MAVRLLAEQRDLYAYLHDQTLRMLNQGLNGAEIAEAIQLPPALERAWHARGYYGSVSHNVKAIYQRYMGWYDGNPARLWQHTPVDQAKRYVAAMGGIDAVVAHARAAFEDRDLRWAAELLDRAIFADPGHAEARELQARTLEQLAFGAENGPWRNAFLAGATELRHGSFGTPAIVLPGPAAGPRAGADLRRHRDPRATAPGPGTRRSRSASSSPMPMRPTAWTCATASSSTDALLSMARTSCSGCPARPWRASLAGSMDGVAMEGDPAVLARLMAVLDQPDPGFAIVTP